MNERRSARRSSRRSTRSCLGPHERPAFSGPKPVSALGHRRDGLRPQTTHLRRAANPLLKPSLAEGDPHRSMLSTHCSTLTAGASISASSGSSSFNAFRPLQHPHRGGVDFGFEWILIVQCFPPTAAGRRTPNLQGSILILSSQKMSPGRAVWWSAVPISGANALEDHLKPTPRELRSPSPPSPAWELIGPLSTGPLKSARRRWLPGRSSRVRIRGSAVTQSRSSYAGVIHELRGRNSVVECQLPKLDVVGSNPIARFHHAPKSGLLASTRELSGLGLVASAVVSTETRHGAWGSGLLRPLFPGCTGRRQRRVQREPHW
jgi:hypothetical protein